jgi:hypothetical protein
MHLGKLYEAELIFSGNKESIERVPGQVITTRLGLHIRKKNL